MRPALTIAVLALTGCTAILGDRPGLADGGPDGGEPDGGPPDGGPPSCGRLGGLLRDDFHEPEPSRERWSYDPTAPNGVQIENERLRLTVSAAADSAAGLVSRYAGDLHGANVTIYVEPGDLADMGDGQVNIQLYHPYVSLSSPETDLSAGIGFSMSHGMLIGFVDTGADRAAPDVALSGGQRTIASTPYDPQQHAYLRFSQDDAGVITLSSSAMRTGPWKTLVRYGAVAAEHTEFAHAVQLRLSAIGAGQAENVYIDDLDLDEPTSAFCPVAQLPPAPMQLVPGGAFTHYDTACALTRGAQITVSPESAVEGRCSVSSRSLWDFTGASLTIPVDSAITSGEYVYSLRVGDADNFAEVGYDAGLGQALSRLQTAAPEDPSRITTVNGCADPVTRLRAVRVREDRGTLFLDYSQNGTDFQVCGAFDLSLAPAYFSAGHLGVALTATFYSAVRTPGEVLLLF